MTKQEIKRFALAVAIVFLSCLLTFCMVMGAVVFEPHTYRRAANDDAYLMSIQEAVNAELTRAAKETGLSESLLKRHASDYMLREMALQNASDAALVLKGRQVIYRTSFDRETLLLDMQDYYNDRMPEAADRETEKKLRETADQIGSFIDTTTRVIDMERIVHNPAWTRIIGFLSFLGAAGILITFAVMAIALLALYRLTGAGKFLHWIWGISLCSGIVHLLWLILVLASGLQAWSLQPEALAILCSRIVRSMLIQYFIAAAIWLVIAMGVLRVMQGKPVCPKKLRPLLDRLYILLAKRGKKSLPDAADNLAASADAFYESGESDAAVENEERSAEMEPTEPPTAKIFGHSKQELLAIIKKATADSLETLLWRKRR